VPPGKQSCIVGPPLAGGLRGRGDRAGGTGGLRSVATGPGDGLACPGNQTTADLLIIAIISLEASKKSYCCLQVRTVGELSLSFYVIL